jgi:RND family efflux transporter MFP subunit
MNKRYSNSVIIPLVLVGLTIFSACSDKEAKKEQAETVKQENAIDTPAVQLAPVVKGRFATSITVPGELIPYQEVDLYAKINSYVKKLLVDIGSEVHKGQLLVLLEAPEINSQLASAKSKIQQMQALYIASKANYDRLYNTSKTPGTVAQNDLDQAEARKNSDLANVEAAKSDYNQVAANLAYLEIRAPFDGVISARNINAGAYVGPSGKGSDMPLLVLQEQSRLRLVISVPEANTGGLSNKNIVTFSVKALPNEKFKAQVKRLAGALDERLRSERLEMDVYNNERKLLPNMYADVDVPQLSRDSNFIVPKTAVVTSTEKVFVVKVVNHHAVWVDVQKGAMNKDKMVVFGDLKPGDQLVQKASDEIRDGQPVKDSPAKTETVKANE